MGIYNQNKEQYIRIILLNKENYKDHKVILDKLKNLIKLIY
jgi:hypothetical protein